MGTRVTPDPTARLRLDVALDQLLNPETTPLDRDHKAARGLLRAANQAHLDRIRELTRRLRHAHRNPLVGTDRDGRSNQTKQLNAIHTDLRAAGARHRARRAELTIRLDLAAGELPPLLEALEEAVMSTGGAGNASRGVHRSPLNSSAVEVLADIERATGHRVGPLADSLRAWQPEDVDAAADRAERWVVEARAIINPSRWMEAKRSCPACGTRHVWVAEDGGQRIRKAALQVNLTDGHAACIAPACGAHWDRTRIPLLVAALEQDDVAS